MDAPLTRPSVSSTGTEPTQPPPPALFKNQFSTSDLRTVARHWLLSGQSYSDVFKNTQNVEELRFNSNPTLKSSELNHRTLVSGKLAKYKNSANSNQNVSGNLLLPHPHVHKAHLAARFMKKVAPTSNSSESIRTGLHPVTASHPSRPPAHWIFLLWDPPLHPPGDARDVAGEILRNTQRTRSPSTTTVTPFKVTSTLLSSPFCCEP